MKMTRERAGEWFAFLTMSFATAGIVSQIAIAIVGKGS
jgi:hypothetical protein